MVILILLCTYSYRCKNYTIIVVLQLYRRATRYINLTYLLEFSQSIIYYVFPPLTINSSWLLGLSFKRLLRNYKFIGRYNIDLLFFSGYFLKFKFRYYIPRLENNRFDRIDVQNRTPGAVGIYVHMFMWYII